MRVENVPLSFYRRTPLGNLKVSSLDRFGTNLEFRFSRVEMEEMMRKAGLEDIRFQERPPYWIALGRASGASGSRGTAEAAIGKAREDEPDSSGTSRRGGLDPTSG
jgi:hypothetical protein